MQALNTVSKLDKITYG